MNYLAHAFLSPDHDLILMGNLWGDLIRPKDYNLLTSEIILGTILHKKIDAYTDNHDHVKTMRTLLRPTQGKYTPVITDVIMDFVLCKYWHLYTNESLESFCNLKYKVVRNNLHLIPSRLHYRIERMLENRWLESCNGKDRMKTTLQMLSGRAHFENTMNDAMTDYESHASLFDNLFLSFFEDLRNYISLRSED